MADLDRGDDFLEGCFRAARDAGPVPSGALMARILADAEAEMPRASAPQPLPRPAGKGGAMMSWLAAAFGGWRGIGGLATATVAGLWLGYAGLDDPALLTGGLWGDDGANATVELMPGAEVFALAAGWEG
ncbi:dihydroorotate dehydrogenase [Defluviimonas sp. SAOS-178_SWC]|uniref:dihydroorotate dehydrogenase n=1 Tax=Defluviimonas sp. SAOS-178_SWC TaxID=3121287 RepID=UPI003221DC37